MLVFTERVTYNDIVIEGLTLSNVSRNSSVSSELGMMMFMAYLFRPTSTSPIALAPSNMIRGGQQFKITNAT